MDPTNLHILLLEASSDIQHQIDQSSAKTIYSKRWYNYRSDAGLVLEILSRDVSLEDDMSLGQLRKVIDGLSLYMMQERRSRVVKFQMIQNLGATRALVTNVGSIRQDVASSMTKREIPPLRLMQDSPTSSLPRIVNASTLSLLKSDHFPIPHSDYTLGFGFFGAHVYLWDLENLLTAVSVTIEEELAAHGRLALLPSEEYSKDLAGLQFWIHRMPWSTENLAWAQLAVILNGLWLYFVDGRHDREAFIDVVDNVTRRQIALGWIGKPQRPLELPPAN